MSTAAEGLGAQRSCRKGENRRRAERLPEAFALDDRANTRRLSRRHTAAECLRTTTWPSGREGVKGLHPFSGGPMEFLPNQTNELALRGGAR